MIMTAIVVLKPSLEFLVYSGELEYSLLDLTPTEGILKMVRFLLSPKKYTGKHPRGLQKHPLTPKWVKTVFRFQSKGVSEFELSGQAG